VDKGLVVGVFGGFVALGVVYGVMAVVIGVPQQVQPAYSVASAGTEVVSADVAALAGGKTPVPTGAAGASTGSAGATGSTAATSAGPEDGSGEVPPPDRPARVGQPLTNVPSPPEGTVVMMEPRAATAGSRYEVTFAPYGGGPESGGQPQLLIKVISARPLGKPANAFAFANLNVLANLAPDAVDKVKTGGLYRGIITLVSQEGLSYPVLSAPAAVTVRK
jgi:hypothetical protein